MATCEDHTHNSNSVQCKTMLILIDQVLL